MAKLSAFADEVTEDFSRQVDFLVKEDVRFIEPRFINKKNIMDLSKAELKEARAMLRYHGIMVSAIGSPIGKVSLAEPFGPHLDKFKRAVDIAVFFDTPFIRMFSYYAPEGKNIDDFRNEVMDRMQAKVEAIADAPVVMVHENETGIVYCISRKNVNELSASLQMKGLLTMSSVTSSQQSPKKRSLTL